MQSMRAEALEETRSQIRTRPVRTCHVCGGEGEVAYTGLRDRLFHVPGEWRLRRCLSSDCGLLWLDPMPIVEDLPRLYDNYYTHEAEQAGRWAALRGAVEAAYATAQYGYAPRRSTRAAALAGLLRLSPGHRAQADLRIFGLAAKPNGRLLDVGCGNGAAMIRMRNLGWVVEGVDFDAEAVERARSRGLHVHLGGLEDQRYADSTFDAVVMSHVLEHVSDPRALLRECCRILRPSGQFACVTPNASSSCHRIFQSDWRGLEPPRHLHIFTSASLSHLAKEEGWSSFSVKSTIARTHTLMLESKKIRRRTSSSDSHAPHEVMAARLFQSAVAFSTMFFQDVGEELVLHATKAGNS